ncbi:TPR-like protein [Mycena chlorophos]|uniref:TPR-like protein n=1 Tax=Mycena chlorophos TaxID=658473 RepID=A0A8H6SP79_MYCCL|nr:TPR-like protein [Mycena chlorophos]
MSTKAEELKAQGNTLYGQGNYAGSYQKYCEAIAEDPNNAVFYFNRAAASLALKKYINALDDAQKATTLNPSYTKAWARTAAIAEKLSLWATAQDAYNHAISTLKNTSDLSPQDCTDKKREFESAITRAATSAGHKANQPWYRALPLFKQNRLQQGSLPSSGFSILGAAGVGVFVVICAPLPQQHFEAGYNQLQEMQASR